MLTLNADQTLALEALKRSRDLRALEGALGGMFPEIAARAGERFGALIAHGTDRSRGLLLTHNVCIARYLACWFVLGAEFESRAEFPWARNILNDTARPQGGRIFQLCRRVRETLAKPGGGQPTTTAFDEAIARIDSALMPRGEFGSLLPTPRLQLGQPCDVDQFDIAWVGAPCQYYRVDRGQWLRSAAPLPPPLAITAAEPGPARIYALGRSSGEKDFPRLKLRVHAAQSCDKAMHPLLGQVGANGAIEWRGDRAESVLLPLITEPPPEGIAVPGAPSINQFTVGACGLRDSGPTFGSRTLSLAVYPAAQHLLAWRRDAAPGTTPQVRYERDGQALNAGRWQAGLAELDRQLAAGLGRLSTLWERQGGISDARTEFEPAAFVGSGGLTWGLDAGASLADPPLTRVAGVLDLTACRLQLRFSGRLELLGARSQLVLHCASSEPLRVEFGPAAELNDPAAVLGKAQTRFRQPFALQAEAIAGDDPPALIDVASPPTGAVVGACGLRMRNDGPGIEWFYELALEPVNARFTVSDPLLGTATLVRPLLPGLKLVQWSMA